MSKLLSYKNLLIIICIFFLFTRLYKINEIPRSVYWDEASIGYNAYSLVETGKDEWGDFFPVNFRAFGEFKLPVYIYAVSIFVKVFGLNEFSVRFPSVLFSFGVVILIYFIAKKITKNKTLGILASFFVCVSPWFFIFSRTGYEATAGLMFYLLGIYQLFLIKKKNYFLLTSMLSFILSMYSYNSFRVIVPLTLIILIAGFYRDLQKSIKTIKYYLILSLIIIILSLIPVYRLYKYDSGISRFQSVGILTISSISKNYLSHFGLNFLIHGDNNQRSQQSGFGQIYLIDFVLLPLGLIYICRKSQYKFLFIALFLLTPLPAALTKESPHALRSISIVPFLGILSAAGIFQIKEYLKVKYLEIGIVVLIFTFFLNYFLAFLQTYPIQSSKDWQYGYKQIYQGFKNEFTGINKTLISDEYAQPYIFALFYLKYNPSNFQKTVIRNDVSNWGFSTVSKFDKFEFGKIDKLLKEDQSDSLLIFAAKEDILGINQLTSIKFLDGDTAFRVFKR